MSEQLEDLRIRINKNRQKIELFRLVDDKYSKLTINHLQNENIKLTKLLTNLQHKEVIKKDGTKNETF